ncbi:hypothetical protein PHYPSEUDO_007721 [Phytophthora pseudosyringae]|uniref:Uncharacterized protein n=1 Tax=Phytophthora pseudosyringae TaxID=221518 RepID=A0A8T1WB27_9STRA|nr:hypothetical protein PHYPSEUDO_007721 [Phytophthora pseudosyringae]
MFDTIGIDCIITDELLKMGSSASNRNCKCIQQHLHGLKVRSTKLVRFSNTEKTMAKEERSETEAGASRARKAPSTAALPQLYIEKLVAYSPAKESWLSSRLFDDAGSAYSIGRV